MFWTSDWARGVLFSFLIGQSVKSSVPVGQNMLTAHIYWCSLKVIYCFTVMSSPGERETEEAGVTTSQADLGPGWREAGLVASSYHLSSQKRF